MSDDVKGRPNPWPIALGAVLVLGAAVTVLLGDANLRTLVLGVVGVGLLAVGIVRSRA